MEPINDPVAQAWLVVSNHLQDHHLTRIIYAECRSSACNIVTASEDQNNRIKYKETNQKEQN